MILSTAKQRQKRNGEDCNQMSAASYQEWGIYLTFSANFIIYFGRRKCKAIRFNKLKGWHAMNNKIQIGQGINTG